MRSIVRRSEASEPRKGLGASRAAVWGLVAMAVAGLVAALVLAAPLVSILLVGLLLLCPLLLWVPSRFERRPIDEPTPERRGHA